MHFVSLKSDPVVDYVEFYRNKFPLAFKKVPEDDEEKEPEWTDAKYEKRFAKLNQELDKCVKDKQSALALLNTLDSYRDIVIELPVRDKSDCSIKRFYLYLLPLF